MEINGLVELKENIEIANNFNRYFVDSFKIISEFIKDMQYSRQFIMVIPRLKLRIYNNNNNERTNPS